MPERRTVPRRKMAFYFQVLDAATRSLFGHLTDISIKGMMIDRSQPTPVDSAHELRIQTPPGMADTEYIVFSVRCRWCRPDPITPNVYNTGFEIVRITPHDAEVLQRLIDAFAS